MPHRPDLPEEFIEPQVEESHPIHDTSKIDVVVQTDRGAAYGLVIAAPVTGSLSTQTRLLDKIEAYIGDFCSPSFLSKYGEPTSEYCKITVAIHPASDPVIFELLEKCRPWVESHNIRFTVQTDLGESLVH
jgi:hypothetical protein